MSHQLYSSKIFSALKVATASICTLLVSLTETKAADYIGIDLSAGCGYSTVVDIYSPPGANNLPIIMMVHGGGWVSGSRSGFTGIARRFRELGFVTVNIDYPLSPWAPLTASIPKQIASLQCIRQWLDYVAPYIGGNAQKVGLLGHSAGGHLATITGIVEGPARIKAIVSWGGVYDLEPFVGSTALNYLAPIYRIAWWSPPIRVLHGVWDSVVPYSQANAIGSAAWRAGNGTTQVITVWGGHDVQPYDQYIASTHEFFYAFLKMR